MREAESQAPDDVHVLTLRRSTRASEVRRIVPAGGGDILDRTADLAAISLPAGRIPSLGGEFTAEYDMVSVLLSVRPNVNGLPPKFRLGVTASLIVFITWGILLTPYFRWRPQSRRPR